MHTKRKEAQSRAKAQRHNNSYLFNWLLNNCGNRISSLRKAKKTFFFSSWNVPTRKIIPYMKHGCQEKISKNFQKICYPIIPNACSLHRTKALKRVLDVKKNLVFLHFTVKVNCLTIQSILTNCRTLFFFKKGLQFRVNKRIIILVRYLRKRGKKHGIDS